MLLALCLNVFKLANGPELIQALLNSYSFFYHDVRRDCQKHLWQAVYNLWNFSRRADASSCSLPASRRGRPSD